MSITTPPQEWSRRGWLHQHLSSWGSAAAMVTLVMGASLVLLPFVHYPFNEDGVDSKGRDVVLGVLIAVLSVARLRSPRTTARSAMALLLLGAVVLLAPLLLGSGLDGPLRWVWLVEVAVGVVLVPAAVVQVLDAGRSRSVDDRGRRLP